MQTTKEQTDAQPEAVTLFEVIADHPNSRAGAFGMTFTDEGTAQAFANRLVTIGYEAEVSPAFTTEATLETALQSAAEHFADQKITKA
jgi:hypothetical protein